MMLIIALDRSRSHSVRTSLEPDRVCLPRRAASDVVCPVVLSEGVQVLAVVAEVADYPGGGAAALVALGS